MSIFSLFLVLFDIVFFMFSNDMTLLDTIHDHLDVFNLLLASFNVCKLMSIFLLQLTKVFDIFLNTPIPNDIVIFDIF
ncbi:hypothetical protein SLS58_007189 [Diplodia intermedia]|uniref:Uncharacterized protein n=1 Tax=Diplodia intermedia TaxID=856260 RepID=A0ABR3TKZ3_9PEZI